MARQQTAQRLLLLGLRGSQSHLSSSGGLLLGSRAFSTLGWRAGLALDSDKEDKQGPNPQGWQPWQLTRGFCSSSVPSQHKTQLAGDVLQQINVLKLREELQLEAENNLHIPFSRFSELARSSGASTSPEQDGQLADTLHKAGIIIRVQDTVYLRAEEVSEMVMQMLPGGKDVAEQKLAKVEQELAEMDNLHAQLERRGRRMADSLLFLGLVVLVTQFVAFIYLTWWELSWDVMEPIAYIISLFYSIVGWLYFMFMRHAFDLEPAGEFWAKHFKVKRMEQVKFDQARFEYLRRLRERYQRHLAHARIQA